MMNIKSEKSFKEIYAELKEMGFGLDTKVFDSMTYSELKKYYRKAKRAFKMCMELEEVASGKTLKSNLKNSEKNT